MPPGRAETLLLVAYLVMGPLAWATYGLMLSLGRRKMLLMRRPIPEVVAPAPSVVIVIPAKDEGERIRACLTSALNQDYPNFRVIAIDDRSVDQTGAVMDEVAAANPRLHVLHVTRPPAVGWTGKNNALFTAVRDTSDDWLLFVDSDVILEPHALSATMGVSLRKKFDLLSLLPRLESHTFWERLVVPLCGSAASSLYLIALTNNSQVTANAFANGQFLLINRESYKAIGGHETVRDRFCEDVEIARLLKSRGLRPRVSWGNEYAAVRMYSSLGAIIRGWSRIYYSARVGSPWTIVAGLSFLLLCCFSAYAALAWGTYRTWRPTSLALGGHAGLAWLAVVAVHLVLMTWLVGILYKWSGNSRRNAFWFPVGGSLLTYILLRALKMCITKKVEWRGTAYSHTMAQQLGGATPPRT